MIDEHKKKQEDDLLRQISAAQRDTLYVDRYFDDFKKNVFGVDRDNRTDARDHILTLLTLIEEQVGKHNGIIKRKIGVLEKQLHRLRYQ